MEKLRAAQKRFIIIFWLRVFLFVLTICLFGSNIYIAIDYFYVIGPKSYSNLIIFTVVFLVFSFFHAFIWRLYFKRYKFSDIITKVYIEENEK